MKMQTTLPDGVKVFYSIRGQGDDLVLLHPVGQSHRFWDALVSRLEDDYRTVTLDFPGHGESDAPKKSFSLNDLAEKVSAVIETTCESSATVIGCSLGGMVAQALALRHPAAVRALVMCNSSYEITPERRPMMLDRAAQASQGMAVIADETMRRWFSAKFYASHPEVVASARTLFCQTDILAYNWYWQAIADLRHADKLDQIAVPALVVSGDQDKSAPPSVGRALAASMPRGVFALAEESGHVTPLERPVWLSNCIKSFIRVHLTVS